MIVVRHIVQLLIFLLFATLGAVPVLAMPQPMVDTHYTSFKLQITEQSNYIAFTARAPPMAVPNVALTGGVTVMQGGAFTLHGQETDVFSFNPVNNINKDLFKTH